MLINLNPIRPPSPLSSEGFDISLLGECDDVVAFLAEMIQIDKGNEQSHNALTSLIFAVACAQIQKKLGR